MSNYTKSTNFATKDNLSSGNPLKIVKGTEIDTEFNNIATAVATKADLASPTFTGSPVLPTGTTGVTQSSSDDTTKLATTAFVQDVADVIKSALFPVGAIYTATVSTNPATLLGFGSWSAFGAGRVLIGNGGGFSAGATGGSADSIVISHTHTYSSTTGSSGTHQHNLQFAASSADDGPSSSGGTRTDSGGAVLTMNGNHLALSAGAHTHSISGTTNSTGSSGTNANLPPYVVVYMWQRTA
jgi:hypothetical protein